MERRSLVLLAAAGSAAILLGALGFQYIGGLAPCPICIWQRWPHLAAVIVGVLALRLRSPVLPALGGLAALATAGIGLYHTGIERKWWAGPSSCTGDAGGLSGLSGSDLLSTDAPSGLVMCDQVAWEMWGLSMASWNVVFSVLFALLWFAALRRALSEA